jgi:hypothetical protein
MSLKDWLNNGWLVVHRTSRAEVADLLTAADRDLQDARTPGLSPAWSFNIAYNAALHLCNLALAAEGYRPARDSKHYRTIAALDLILGPRAGDLVAWLDHCRALRHDVTYEGARSISRKEADELLGTVRELKGKVLDWLKESHPELE